MTKTESNTLVHWGYVELEKQINEEIRRIKESKNRYYFYNLFTEKIKPMTEANIFNPSKSNTTHLVGGGINVRFCPKFKVGDTVWIYGKMREPRKAVINSLEYKVGCYPHYDPVIMYWFDNSGYPEECIDIKSPCEKIKEAQKFDHLKRINELEERVQKLDKYIANRKVLAESAELLKDVSQDLRALLDKEKASV